MENIITKLGKVAVIYGGDSSERDISLLSGKMIIHNLKQLGVDVVGLDVSGYELVHKLQELKITRCFIALHGDSGENGSLQGLLECLKIPYTGANVLSSAISMNKYICKILLNSHDIKSPKGHLMNNDNDIKDIKFPAIIKPYNQGSSVGVFLVNSQKELSEKYLETIKYSDVLIEEYITGKEIAVSILDYKALPIVHIKPTGNDFYNLSAKYSGSSEYICPANFDDFLTEKIQKQALKISIILKISKWSRIDFIINNDNEIYFIEANTIPGMTENSLFPKSSVASGLNNSEMILKLLKTTL